MPIHYYNQSARTRIRDAVQWVEQQFEPRVVKRVWNPPAVVDRFVIAASDIEHAKRGEVTLIKSYQVDGELSERSDSRLERVYNPGLKIWAGAQCVVSRMSIAEANDGEAHTWYVHRAWSATRLRGKTTGEIQPGQTGTITVQRAVDGHFGLATATVHLPTEYVVVKADRVVWVELAWTGSVSRWEIYSADCDGA